MATDPTAPRSRRAVLVAATGVAAAGVVSALARPSAVLAGTDGDVVLGGSNTASSTTTINVTGEHCALDVYTAAANEAAVDARRSSGVVKLRTR